LLYFETDKGVVISVPLHHDIKGYWGLDGKADVLYGCDLPRHYLVSIGLANDSSGYVAKKSPSL
jgi:hypothetical protein